MKRKLTVTEAARNFSEVVNRVFYRGESMELTRGGKVVARIVPAGGVEAPTPAIPFDVDCARVHARLWERLEEQGKLIGAHESRWTGMKTACGWRSARRSRVA